MSIGPDSTPEETEAWIKRTASEGAETAGKLIAFAKAMRKLKLGATGGRVTLVQDDCKALIWGIKLLKERDKQ